MKRTDESTESLVEEIKGCRVYDIGLEGMAECQDRGPKACPYALPFGYGFLCRHPRLDVILERTRKEEAHQLESK
jgi:hypothetical protein